MARTIFQAVRRRRRRLGAIFALALLLNALAAAVFNVAAIAAALDPLTSAATCDGGSSGQAPVPHKSQHQPDCTLCSPACSMNAPASAMGGATAVSLPAPVAIGLDAQASRASPVTAPSIYRSDSSAQAPPAVIG